VGDLKKVYKYVKNADMIKSDAGAYKLYQNKAFRLPSNMPNGKYCKVAPTNKPIVNSDGSVKKECEALDGGSKNTCDGDIKKGLGRKVESLCAKAENKDDKECKAHDCPWLDKKAFPAEKLYYGRGSGMTRGVCAYYTLGTYVGVKSKLVKDILAKPE